MSGCAANATGALIDRARYVQGIDREIFVACDEWNVWYRTDDGRLEERYNVQSLTMPSGATHVTFSP